MGGDLDEAKYYAMVLTMAQHMPMATEAQRTLRKQALARMAEAVSVECVERGKCRDIDPAAAVHVRARW